MDVLAALRQGLVVSCQAADRSPMDDATVIAAIAETVVGAGAAGIRINSPRHIEAVRERVDVPIIGLHRLWRPDSPLSITPTLDAALAVAEAGADIVALDATLRRRPPGQDLADVIREVRRRTGKLVMADIATFEEGLNAARLGADLVSTTLAGYTEESESSPTDGPDLELLHRLARDLEVPVVADGRYHEPALVRAAFDAGAFCVVVGNAITSPGWITARFLQRSGTARLG